MSFNIDSQTPAAKTTREELRLEQLTPEILLAIASELSDLASLRNLTSASPVVFRLFNLRGVEITESVLAAGLTSRHIQEIIRVITLIRSSALPINNLDDFIRRIVSESMKQHRSKEAFIPTSLSQSTSPAVLRSILASALQISYLTQSCLQYYLKCVRAIALEHVVDPSFNHHEYGPDEYTPQDIGPPSWVEEQRVARAFWRILVFYDLKMAAVQSRLRWPKEDLERLHEMIPQDLYNNPDYPEFEEIITTYDYIQIIRATAPILLATATTNTSQLPLPPRESLTTTISQLPLSSLPSPPTHRHLVLPAPSIWFFRGLTSSVFSPVHGIPFTPFRRLGFAFWDQERMSALGLMHPPAGPFTQPVDFYYIVWKNLLTADEVVEGRTGEVRGGVRGNGDG